MYLILKSIESFIYYFTIMIMIWLYYVLLFRVRKSKYYQQQNRKEVAEEEAEGLEKLTAANCMQCNVNIHTLHFTNKNPPRETCKGTSFQLPFPVTMMMHSN